MIESLQKKVDELEALGSAWAISTYLEEKQIKGIPKDEDACALVNYLYNDAEDFNVDISELSPNVQEFVKAFDRGEYPNLIQS